MAEKIVTEYEIATQQSIANLQAVSNKLIETDKNVNKLGVDASKTLNQVSQSVNKTTTSFNGLSNSVAQIGRELPNFALNAQTGFLAISNNLPILFDNLQRVREENIALAASGQKTTSVFKQVVSSVFSLQTALTLIITLTVLYGKELGSFVSSLFKGSEAFDTAKARLDALNAAYDSKELKSAVKGIIELTTNVEKAKNGFINQELVIKQYNESIGLVSGSVKTLEEVEKGIINNTRAYVDAIIAREAANKIASDAAETLIQLRKTQLKDEKEFITTSVTLSATQFKDVKDNAEALKQIREQEVQDRARLAKEAKEAEVKRLQEQFDAQIELINGFQKEAGKTATPLESIKTAFEQIGEEIAKTKLAINNGILGGADVSADITKLDELEQKLRMVETAFNRLRNPQELPSAPDISTVDPLNAKGVSESAKSIEKESDRLNKKLLDNAKETLKANENNAKYFGKLEEEKTKKLEEEAKKRKGLEEQAIRGVLDISTQVEQGIFNLRRANLENETNIQLKELEKQKENKQITEEQFEQKKSQLLNKQAQTQRELDLAQIKVQTALAVVRSFALFGFTPAGVLAAGLAAIEGGIQYAFASAQPLPRFAKGTDRVKGGLKGQDSVLAMLMPDEAVIPAKRNLERPELAKAWINGDLDRHLTMNYIRPAIEANNKKWEKEIKINQSSQFIRNDNFNDKRIVQGLDKINRKLTKDEKVIYKRNRRLWN